MSMCCLNLRTSDDAMSADLEIGFKLFSERYRSNVRLERPVSVTTTSENTILFSHFDSSWHFEPGPVPNSTRLSFHVDFGFRSPLYRQAVDVVFDQVWTSSLPVRASSLSPNTYTCPCRASVLVVIGVCDAVREDVTCIRRSYIYVCVRVCVCDRWWYE